MMNENLNLNFCRSQFPPLGNGWAYFENAGGSYVPESVIDEMTRYMRESQCQPEWEFGPSQAAGRQLALSRDLICRAFNVGADEIVIGPSTTLNVYVLSQALRPTFRPGDEIVLTNQDHEANGGAWRRLAADDIVIREWQIDPDTGELDPARLTELLSERTRLVCFPHVSNIVGSFNDVASITAMAHAAGAMVCVDGVAAVAHNLADLRALDVDFYLLSFYKLYGPHQALLFAKRKHIESAANQNHFFHDGKVPEKLNPGGTNYESCAGLSGIFAYLNKVYDAHFTARPASLRASIERVYGLFQDQEERIMRRFLDYLETRPEIRVIGRRSSSPRERAPTFSLSIDGYSPASLAGALARGKICAGHGHFYGYRCVEALGIDPAQGVLRISMVHYNTLEEVDRLIATLDEALTARAGP